MVIAGFLGDLAYSFEDAEGDPVQAGNTKERESDETAVSLTPRTRSRRWQALLRHLLFP